MSCWRLHATGGGGRHADLVWRHPASRCFPTCSDKTAPLTAADERCADPVLFRFRVDALLEPAEEEAEAAPGGEGVPVEL